MDNQQIKETKSEFLYSAFWEFYNTEIDDSAEIRFYEGRLEGLSTALPKILMGITEQDIKDFLEDNKDRLRVLTGSDLDDDSQSFDSLIENAEGEMKKRIGYHKPLGEF